MKATCGPRENGALPLPAETAPPCCARPGACVVDDDSERAAIASGTVSNARSPPRSGTVRDQVADHDSSLREEPEELRHVPALRPADVRRWVVETPFLVLAVVATRPVRPGKAQLELLLVEPSAVELQQDVPDDDDPSALARQVGGSRNRVVARRRGSGDEHGVAGAQSAAAQFSAQRLSGARRPAPRASRHGSRSMPRTSQPAGLGDPRGELTDETHTHDGDAFTKSNVRLPQPVQRDRPQRRERRTATATPSGTGDAEVPRHGE